MINKNKPSEWWDNDGGFFGSQYMQGDDSITGYLPGKYESLEERTQREVNGTVRLLHFNGGESIIDVPCGYGRHSIELAKRGYKVDGYDLNQEHLIEASKRMVANIDQFPKDEDGCSNIPVFS